MGARDYGDLVRFDGATTMVFSPSVANRILLDRDAAFDVPDDLLGRTLGRAALARTRQLRPLLNPVLRRQRARDVLATTSQLLGAEFDSDSECLHDDPLSVLERLIAESVARFYFGDSAASDVRGAIADLLEALDGHFGNPFALPAFLPTSRRRRIQRCYRTAQERVVDQLRAGEGSPTTVGVASELFSAAASRHGSREAPSSRVAQMIIGSLLAARRVPAAAACWMLYETSRDAVLQEQLRAEGVSLSALGAAQEPDLRSFPLALATALETLRLHPPTWLLQRRATRSSELAGYSVAAGHNFLISPYVLHRDERTYTRAAEFDPRRWSDVRGLPETMMAFGRGPHGCPGSSLGIAVMVAIVLTTVARFRVEAAPGVTANPRSTLVPVDLHIQALPLDPPSIAQASHPLSEALPRCIP